MSNGPSSPPLTFLSCIPAVAVATDSVPIRIYMGCCNAYDPNLFNNGSLPKIKYEKIDNGGSFLDR